MASWQAHLLDALVRVRIKRRLNGNPDLRRARAVLGRRPLPGPGGAVFSPGEAGGIPGEWAMATAPNASSPVLLYLHGGGYLACSPQTHRPITGSYARAGFCVFAPQYRLAPEHPYPAAVQDALAAWHGLRALGHAPGRIAVSGDSAGGGLALAMMLALRDAGEALPACAILFSPWTDLAGTGESMTANAARDAMFHPSALTKAASCYGNGQDARSAGLSPLFAELHGLPPLLIHAGAREVLLDDSTRLTRKARHAGVSVEQHIWPIVPHGFQLALFVPEARECLARAAAFAHAEIHAASTTAGR